MANPEHVQLLLASVADNDGCKAWNEWREKNSRIIPDLNGADLSGIDLQEADLTFTDLGGANLNRSDLRDVNPTGAYFRGADLRGAKLNIVNMASATTTWAKGLTPEDRREITRVLNDSWEKADTSPQ